MCKDYNYNHGVQPIQSIRSTLIIVFASFFHIFRILTIFHSISPCLSWPNDAKPTKMQKRQNQTQRGRETNVEQHTLVVSKKPPISFFFYYRIRKTANSKCPIWQWQTLSMCSLSSYKHNINIWRNAYTYIRHKSKTKKSDD